MDPHLAALFLALDEMATVAEAIRATEHAPDPDDGFRALAGRSDALREKVARATERVQATGAALPAGADGAHFVALMKSFHERIRAGDLARRRISGFRAGLDLFGHRYATQAIANLPAIAASLSVARLRGAFSGKPAVVIAAGPSLGKNIDGLRRFKGKAVLIAVTHALGALERAGIVPDLVIGADPGPLFRHFTGASVERYDALVLATSCDPRLFELPAQRFVTFGANLGIDMWPYDGLEEAVLVPSGGSVANCAVSLVHQWGCNPVILTGQDLSFPDGQMYAPGTCDDSARFEPETAATVRRVPGYHGGEVLTDAGFFAAREWFIDAARALAGKVTMINCTEGGAYLDGMEHVPLAEAAARYLPDAADVSVGKVLDEAAQNLDADARRDFLRARVKDMRAAVKSCAAHAAECRALAAKTKQRPQHAPRLKTAETALLAAVAKVEFLAWAVRHDIRVARAKAKNDPLGASQRIYEAIGTLMQEVTPLLEIAEERLRVGALAPSAA